MRIKIVSLLALLASAALAQNPNTAAFPTAVATDTELLCWDNSGTTTLNGAINNSTLTVVVTDASNLCAPGVITVDSERMKVASIATNTLTIASGGRGFDGSTAASHSDGATVNGYVPAYWLNQIAAEIKAIQTKLTANLASTTFGAGSAITHTFDASGGTDCTAAYGDNSITFTCGTVTFGSGTGTLGMTEGTAPGAGGSAGVHNLYFDSSDSRLYSHENGGSAVRYTLPADLDTSSELAGILGDETGSGAAVFGTSPTIATPVLTGKIDRNNVSVDDDDCTGEQGLYWYDTTDSQFEFCNANSGTPTVLGSGGAADTDGLPEGATNLYYTDARARSAVIAAAIQGASSTNMALRAGASQSGNILAIQNAAGSTLSRFDNEGSLDIGSSSKFYIAGGAFVRWQGAALNLNDSHHVRWSSGQASGPHDVGLVRASAGLLRVSNGATATTNAGLEAADLTVHDNTATTGVTTAVVKAGAGQSTTDLMQWQDNAGTVLARVRSDGDLESPNVLTEDTDDRTTAFIGTDTAEAGTTTTNLTMTAHGLSTNQVICNETRSACSLVTVVDADNVTTSAIAGQASGDAIRTYDYSNRRSSWYHETTPVDDIFLDEIPLGAVQMTWDAPPTRNFDSLIYLDLPAGAAIDKGRGLFVWNHGSSDGINVLADNGGVAAAYICGDASTPTNNSFCEAHEVRSETSIGSYVRSTATAGGPHLMFLDQQSTAAAKPTAMIDITGNAAHTGFNVKNTGGNAGVIYYQALDSEGDVRFQMSGNGIELGDTGDDSAATTFDFHSGSATADYDARILATGGAGTNGTGTLTFYADTVNMTGLTLKADDLDLDDGGTKPTCDSSQRGKFWFEEGAGGVADTVEICGKDAADAYAWVAIATF